MGMPIQRSRGPLSRPPKSKRDISEDEKERLNLAGEL